MTFNDIINSDKPVLVDFYADWCGPCKMMPPILKEVKSSLGDQVKIIKIDSDKEVQLSQKYQIRSIPTLMIFKNGKVLWKEAGVKQASELQIILKQYI